MRYSALYYYHVLQLNVSIYLNYELKIQTNMIKLYIITIYITV